jgi:hypothetical protein
MKDFQQVKVWEKAHLVAVSIYEAIKEFLKIDLDITEVQRMFASFIKILRAES